MLCKGVRNYVVPPVETAPAPSPGTGLMLSDVLPVSISCTLHLQPLLQRKVAASVATRHRRSTLWLELPGLPAGSLPATAATFPTEPPWLDTPFSSSQHTIIIRGHSHVIARLCVCHCQPALYSGA